MPLRITNDRLRHAMLLFLLACCALLWKQPSSVPATANSSYTIYLTFDDGPSVVTEAVLDILKAEGVPATFFVLGATTEHGKSIYRRIVDEGHMIALHSYSHNIKKVYASLKDYTEDLKRLEELIYEATETSTKVCRMVGGSHSAHCPATIREQILSFLAEEDYACYDWDIDARDSFGYALKPNTLVNNVIQSVRKMPKKDLIILMHDDALRVTLPDALKSIITYLKDEGYAFDVLQYGVNSSKRIVPKASDVSR